MNKVNPKRMEANRRMAELKIEITKVLPVWMDRAEILSVLVDLTQWLVHMDLPKMIKK